ncbi:hypothetical protein [Neisseria polysaccharea]|uniref:hypothetical protein n=1 Tax=Neisseria polysaccharea TaxID=489 RepID=UPI00272C341B|nr:hypothetical protein [Neisseria polysaccharea]
MPFGRVGFSPPKQRQTETTAKQGLADWWAEAHPTASYGGHNRPAFRRSQPKQPAHFQAAQSEHQTV